MWKSCGKDVEKLRRLWKNDGGRSGEGDGVVKRWSKLQQRLYSLMDQYINFQIHCSLYEMNSNNGYHTQKLPRYFITIGNEIVFDYPREFDTSKLYGYNSYPWDRELSQISNIVDEYIQRPKDKIFDPFYNDRWGITDILRACDRRVGVRRLILMQNSTDNVRLRKIIEMRLQREVKVVKNSKCDI